jgi:predicted ribosome quality control (RQC) complex YloA/Tae2 family protein
VDGTVFLPRQFGAGYVLRPAASVNELVASVMHAAEWEAEIEDVRRPLRQALRSHLQRSERKAVALAEELRALDGAATFREEADLLMAFAGEVPAHVAQVTLENPFAVDGAPETATLTLDPRFDAIENANRRYARYHKLQRAAKLIPPQIAANEITRAQVEQLLTDLALAETRGEIEAARAGIEAAGYLRNRQERRRERIVKKKPGKQPKAKAAPGGTPLRRQSADGFTLLVGKNSLQNEAVTFDMATGSDLWLHARGVPGAHVIVKSGGRPVPERTLREAAALAAWYSQGRGNSAVAVDATEQRYVRHLKGGGPGMVTYERERTIHAEPADPWAEG